MAGITTAQRCCYSLHMKGRVTERDESDASSPFSDLLSLLGEERMLALLDVCGGIRIKVPTRAPTEQYALAKKVGLETATILHRHYAGSVVDVPLARWFRVRAMSSRGKSYSQIATRLCMVESTVYRHLRDAGMIRKPSTVRKLNTDGAGLTAPKKLP